ncbi:MAG: hypothetical protein JAZ02_06350 [Candidatus Thiodiazotropha endolucinida]|nr:hypothetical protein [Candidatus Thiodiazotropha endolucinida]
MSGHVVIGGGVAGRHHLRVLSDLGRDAVQLIDIADPDYERRWRNVVDAISGEEIWHVCTPTHTHLDYLSLLGEVSPQARVILEKPIGRPGESTAFIHQMKRVDVMVQSQYGYARVVDAFAHFARDSTQDGPLEIDIAFSKKRYSDGRFEDPDRCAFGYEGFHQVAIGLRLIEIFRGELAARLFADTARLAIRRSDLSGYEFEMEANAVRMSLSSVLDREPRSSRITVKGSDGREIALSFETDRWCTGQPRQLHSIHVSGGEMLIEEDLMRTGIETCLNMLEEGDRRGIARNQARALEIEMLLDKACSDRSINLL